MTATASASMRGEPHTRAAVTTRSRSLDMSIVLMWLACSSAAAQAGQDDPQAQSAPTPTPSTDSGSSKTGLPEVIIEARRALEQRAHTFVDKLTHSRRFSNPDLPAPRWNQPLCFEVAGLPRKYAEFVAARLSQIATSVGAPVREECSRFSANFYVVFTPNPAETLYHLNHDPTLLQFHPETTGPQIERFLNPPKSVVVRVWHNAEILGAGGMPLAADYAACFSRPGVVISCDYSGGSRITLAAAPAFLRTLAVVDSTRLQGIQLGQISAYVAMAGLVDVDDDVNLGDTPSILRLFTDPPNKRAEGLTEWDRAFLTALYHTDWRNSQQRGQIVSKIVDEIAR
jgi:hypothetical protein